MGEEEKGEPNLNWVYYDAFTARIRGGWSPGEAHIYASHKKWLARGYKGKEKAIHLVYTSKLKTWTSIGLLVLTAMLFGGVVMASPNIVIEAVVMVVAVGWIIFSKACSENKLGGLRRKSRFSCVYLTPWSTQRKWNLNHRAYYSKS